jgi:hypothetical protein
MAGDPRVRPVYLDPALLTLIKDFADRNGMSESEAIREAMHGFESGQYEPRERVLARKNIWIDPDEYAAFTKKAAESGVTIRHALEIALENML